MHQAQLSRARIVSSIAATLISLACGTNYVYSAWAPQFAEKLHLSSTESNLIGLFGNLGMYTMGVPIGIFVDYRGPRPAVIAGAILLAVGYFPLHQAYDKARGSVAALCFFSYLSGLGGCMAFAAAVKTSALNWPHHRGTATAFPLAAFGLSAFFFSFVGTMLSPGDPSAFLMLLSWGTFGLTFTGFFFLRVYPSSQYAALPRLEPGRRQSHSNHSQRLSRSSAEDPSRYRSAITAALDPGTSSDAIATASTSPSTLPQSPSPLDGENDSGLGSPSNESWVDESSSLMSSPLDTESVVASSVDIDRSRRLDIRGLSLLRQLSFWQLFFIMAILAGVGLMTINNIGNDTKALWKHYNNSVDENFLVNRQQLHVSILSICSFLGRLLSGVGSDFLVKSMQVSRMWCLVVACLIFLLAQFCALSITNPNFLVLVSSLSGLGYGLLFGVFPSIVAETFGIRGLSQNWGFMTLAPVISSNIFNLFYGKMYDQHSIIEPGGERYCHDGLECYRAAYEATLGACIVGLAVTLWTIHHQQSDRIRESKKTDDEQ